MSANAPASLVATMDPPQPGPGFSFADMVEVANDVFIVTTADLTLPGPTIVYVNPAFTRLTGYTASEAIGHSPRMLQGEGTNRATLAAIRTGLRAGREVHQKVLNYAKDGAPYWLDLRIAPLRDRDGTITHFVAIERDVTLDKRRLDELKTAADRDALTGVLNQRALLRTVEAEMHGAAFRGSVGACLATIEVDGFAQLTQDYGRAVGEAVLRGVAELLAENIRRVDTLGRIGGQEFIVCMPDMTLAEATAGAEHIRGAVARTPIASPAGLRRITVGVAVSELRPDNATLARLKQRATAAPG